ncbi:hypothetical protein L1987_54059 [Smallanthus sonchifolius]|uniref:Uncharacterized protein n=1 Tax=Smallanthus sonchifolius TaxID=185202 RepID=A0ACB9E5S7_9ASTR|nr:hypothetical protein L1987_54059 [Smallanthus sonchifolius]
MNDSSFPARSNANSESDLYHRPVRSHKSPVNFTEEKARKLRMLTTETASFHDAMYHSAIASRFASDFSDHVPVSLKYDRVVCRFGKRKLDVDMMM